MKWRRCPSATRSRPPATTPPGAGRNGPNRQLPIVHKVFTPTEDAVARARGVLRLFDEQVQAGASVLIDENGRLLDEAVVRHARRTLNLAGQLQDVS